jgi:ABC-type antimicrobial peptide transport system permease subunit
MIDDVTARRVWPDGNAIGQRFKYSPLVPLITITGIVGHVKNQSFASPFADAQVYLPITQQENAAYRTLLVRSAHPAAAVGAASAVVATVDPAIKVSVTGVVAEAYEVTLGAPRFYLLLMALLAVVAVVTAAIGLYGLLAYSVSQRTREIGVRIALGADLAKLRRLVVGEALGPVLAGIAIGLVGSFWLTRVIRTLLYQVTPHDPLTLAAIVVLLIGVAAIAAVIPVRRAARVDPVAALRLE